MTPERIEQILNEHFPDPQIPLLHHSNYTLLVATLLSAQSTDAKVNEITPTLFARADSPQKMVELSVDEIETIIKPIGLSPTKARNIHALSKKLIESFGGEVPDSFEGLESLPGVGHKTASCVMIHAFKKPAFPVDTHIFRCARRWELSEGQSVEKVEEDLKKLFAKERWEKLHLQMIYFARKYCPAKKHNSDNCPICREL
ncbi:MAG: Endonuclease III [Chlamydiales bacterium]|nr:Endonuclease III [Chlamydiales bacterium]MCH9636264.1 Endonuclease III [Chlamydiales bacterium]MCH9704191.1 endonuclease III [Chlamydiota bacterium]